MSITEPRLKMEEDVKIAFSGLSTTVNELKSTVESFILSNNERRVKQTELCGKRGGEIDVLRQRLDNGEKNESNSMQQGSLDVQKKVLGSQKKLTRFAGNNMKIAALACVFVAWEVIKEFLLHR